MSKPQAIIVDPKSSVTPVLKKKTVREYCCISNKFINTGFFGCDQACCLSAVVVE